MPKPKYTEWLTHDGLLTIKSWARDGFSNEQIAHNIGIAPQTIYTWINEHHELGEALKEGRRPVVTEIEDAFYSKCRWNEYEETREEITKGTDGKEVRKITRIKHKIPPDTATLIFALKNLRPDRWRDKPVTQDAQTSNAFESLMNRINEAIDEP